METLKNKIMQQLSDSAVGRQNPMQSQKLAQKVRCEERQTRIAVAELISDGHAIASAVNFPMGYYIPATREEASECLHHLQSRARGINLRSKNLKKALVKKFGSIK